MKRSLHELDYMRLFMAITVLLCHCVMFGNSKVFGDTTLYFNRWLGCLVVPYFFTLTGFFIRQSDDVIKSGLKMAGRLIKLYVMWSLLYLPVHVLNVIKADNKNSYIKDAFKSFIFGNFPLWYLLGGCIGILLCVGLLRIFSGNGNRLLATGIIIYLCGSIFKYVILFDTYAGRTIGSLGSIGKFMLTDDFVRNGFFFGFPFIALGFFLAEREQKNKTLGMRASLTGVIGSLIVGLIEVRLSYVASDFNYTATGNQLKIFLYPAIFFIIPMLIRISERTVAKDTRHIRKLAGLVYFMHWGIRVFVEEFLHAIKTNSYIFNLLSGSITLALSFGFAFIILRLSDRYGSLKKLY